MLFLKIEEKTENSFCMLKALLQLVGISKPVITIKFLNFWTLRNICCNLPKTQTKRPNLRVFRLKDANGIANSEDPDQTAPRGAV